MEFLTDLPQNQCSVQTQHLWHRQRVSLLLQAPASSEQLFISSSSSIWFFSQSHHFWSWFEDSLQGPGLNHQLVSHGEQHRVTASRAHQSCTALFSSVYMKRVHFLLFFFPKELFSNCSEEGRKIKSPTLVLCGEATCFSQPTRIHSWALAWGQQSFRRLWC